MFRRVVTWAGVLVPWVLLAPSTASPQESSAQADALAMLAKIDGKVKFDPAHPNRVVAIDI
jgi:hypothetical protein